MNNKGDIYIFSIIRKEDHQLLGNVSLWEIHPTHRRAILGILIGAIDEHNKGYGTDAINCILNYAFNQLNLQTVELRVYDFNEKAKKCYEKCWFQIIGRRRQSYFNNGKYHDAIYMDITKDDFNNNHY